MLARRKCLRDLDSDRPGSSDDDDFHKTYLFKPVDGASLTLADAFQGSEGGVVTLLIAKLMREAWPRLGRGL